MVNMSRAYATWRWNHCDSSRGSHLILGRTTRRRFRHMGSRMRRTSKDSIRPAPRDIHTEKVKVLRPASSTSLSCRYLRNSTRQLRSRKEGHRERREGEERESKSKSISTYHPNAKRPQCPPQKMTLKASFRPVSWRLNHDSAIIRDAELRELNYSDFVRTGPASDPSRRLKVKNGKQSKAE